MKLGMKLVYIAMVMMCAAIEAPWPGSAHGVDDDPELIMSSRRIAQEFLDAHNEMRVAAGVASPLVWNETLVEVAKTYAEQQCASLVTSCSTVSAVDGVIIVSRCVLGLQSPWDAITMHWARSDNMGVVTRDNFASYDKHCHGEEGDGSSGGNIGGSVSRPAPAPLSGTNLPPAPSPGVGGVSSSDPFPFPPTSAPAPIIYHDTPSTGNIVDGKEGGDHGECDGGEGDGGGSEDNMGVITPGKFASYDKHCHGKEGDGSSGGSTSGSVSRPALAPLSGTNLPPAPSPGAGGVFDSNPFPFPPTSAPTLIIYPRPDTPSTSNIVDGEEGGDHEECDGGEGDGGGLEAESYAQVMMLSQTMNTGCYNLQCTKNGMSYAACGYCP